MKMPIVLAVPSLVDESALEDDEWLIASRAVDYDLLRGAPAPAQD